MTAAGQNVRMNLYVNTQRVMELEREQVYNFAAGPSVMPEQALRMAAAELLNYHGSGMSVMDGPQGEVRIFLPKEKSEQAERRRRDLILLILN